MSADDEDLTISGHHVHDENDLDRSWDRVLIPHAPETTPTELDTTCASDVRLVPDGLPGEAILCHSSQPSCTAP